MRRRRCCCCEALRCTSAVRKLEKLHALEPTLPRLGATSRISGSSFLHPMLPLPLPSSSLLLYVVVRSAAAAASAIEMPCCCMMR